MRDRFPLFLVTGLLVLGAFGSFLLGGARRGAFADRLSTYRSEKSGARAVYLLLESAGVPVGRWQQDFLVIEPNSTIVSLGTSFGKAFDEESTNPGKADAGFWDTPDQTEEEKEELRERGLNTYRSPPISEDETTKLLEHVRNGGTLVYAPWDDKENELLTTLNIYLTRATARTEIVTLVPAQPSRFTAGVERLEARVRVWLDLPPGSLALYLDEEAEQAVVGVVPYGQGRVILLGAPELAMNQALSRADNALFWRSLMAPLAAMGPVAFDEFHHGFTGSRSIAEFAARYGMQFALGQLLLGVMLWAASLKRFGRPKPPPDEQRIGATDALDATARLYRDGKHHGHAASSIARELAVEYAQKAGVPQRAEPSEISAALHARGRKDLAAALLDVTRAAAAAHTEAEVETVARLAALARLTLDDTPKKGRTP